MSTSAPRRPARKSGSPPLTDGSPRRSASETRSDNVSRVYEELRGLIVWGHLPPGARIAERAVAERLGLSRTPVRSALHRLQQEGFVSSVGRGQDQRLIVAPLTQEDGREIILIVGHLEGLAAHTAALLPDDRRRTIVARLRELNRELAAESKRRVFTRIFDLDQAFHQAYVEDVVGPRLLALHRAIKPQIERYTRLYISVLVDEIATSVKEHDIIIRAIAAGDAPAAQRAVETNWRNAATRLAKVIAQLGERGSWHAWEPAPSRRTGRR
ncbi:MAG TPA: GntR family transcriptional regulator [Gemmatimonadaceae bacterium]|nr:GntR family transcriptional regulator [Gemmatimonadaceae bacterium]